ncbi:MAG: ribosomal protein L3 glutamine methyltransferase [Limisphaerales bacterium]|jgi:ribosomal protein L3 glutamine methyltransferase
MPETSVSEAIANVHAQFSDANLVYGHGTDNAWDEAVALVLSVGGYADDESSLDVVLPEAIQRRVAEIAELRVSSRQPLPYLLGRAQYAGLEFIVRPGVIVPRSPIGFLLPDAVKPWLPVDVTSVIDLCAGSGCLGLLAAYIFPNATVTLVELDDVACEIAQENIALHNLSDRVALVQSDVLKLDGTSAPSLDRADLVLCNPPYVNAQDMATLPPEYQSEPIQSLAAGENGLSLMLPLIAKISGFLKPRGIFIGEVGASAPALIASQPELPLIWLDLPQGGEGVFLLEADALNSHTARHE